MGIGLRTKCLNESWWESLIVLPRFIIRLTKCVTGPLVIIYKVRLFVLLCSSLSIYFLLIHFLSHLLFEKHIKCRFCVYSFWFAYWGFPPLWKPLLRHEMMPKVNLIRIIFLDQNSIWQKPIKSSIITIFYDWQVSRLVRPYVTLFILSSLIFSVTTLSQMSFTSEQTFTWRAAAWN